MKVIPFLIQDCPDGVTLACVAARGIVLFSHFIENEVEVPNSSVDLVIPCIPFICCICSCKEIGWSIIPDEYMQLSSG